MSVLELKGNILQLLARLENRSHLTKVHEILTQFLIDEEITTKDIEGYDDLSPEQQKDLMEAIAETYDESKLVSHEDALKRFDRWLTK